MHCSYNALQAIRRVVYSVTRLAKHRTRHIKLVRMNCNKGAPVKIQNHSKHSWKVLNHAVVIAAGWSAKQLFSQLRNYKRINIYCEAKYIRRFHATASLWLSMWLSTFNHLTSRYFNLSCNAFFTKVTSTKINYYAAAADDDTLFRTMRCVKHQLLQYSERKTAERSMLMTMFKSFIASKMVLRQFCSFLFAAALLSLLPHLYPTILSGFFSPFAGPLVFHFLF